MGYRLIETQGKDDLALVHILEFQGDPRKSVETVDSIDPRFTREEKTVIIVSTQFGCPVGCLMCEAGGLFYGNLSCQEILDQIRFIIKKRPVILNSQKIKIHFARMGEPSLNPAVITALENLSQIIKSPGLMPCISTMLPQGSESFLLEVGRVKDSLYPGSSFQLQFSLNSTNQELREHLIPTPHLPLTDVANLGRAIFHPGDRKIGLNFALAKNIPVDVPTLASTFDTDVFMIKLTPVNPTERSKIYNLDTVLSAADPEAAQELVDQLRAAGFDTIVSIGNPEEIDIGSNCGQLIRAHNTALIGATV